jgi:hypothetical protein
MHEFRTRIPRITDGFPRIYFRSPHHESRSWSSLGRFNRKYHPRRVHSLNSIGAWFLEIVYKNALIEELVSSGLAVDGEKIFPVFYRGKQVGRYIADIVIDGL